MKMERYVRKKGEKFYWQPTKAMKEAGFYPEPLGTDARTANARAKILNDEWTHSSRPINRLEAGTVKWLFDEFTKDPKWYRDKAPRTREGIDRAFRYVLEVLGDDAPVAAFQPRHGLALYNRLYKDRGPHVARDTIKWFRRAMRYSVRIGIRNDNPMAEFEVVEPDHRNTRWTQNEVEAVITAALTGGKADSGNEIPPRPSIALATAIAYDTSLQQIDVLHLTWDQWDGAGFTVHQIKERGGRRLYLPVNEETKAMIDATERRSTYIIVCEQTGNPFIDPPDSHGHSRRTAFSRIFGRFRERAGVDKDKWFSDLRRTALSELGNSGSTETEIVSISGHRHGSPVLNRYVVADKAAALAAAQKRWNTTGKNSELEKVGKLESKNSKTSRKSLK
jgi:hypothetical protein